MKKLKVLGAILTVTLLIGSFAGCSSKKSDTNTKNNTVKSQTDNTKTPKKEAAKTETTKTPEPVAEVFTEEVNPFKDTVLSDENHLTNPKAAKEARVLYNFLQSTYGKYILSGQQESTWMGSPDYEMKYIKEKTGRLPAIRGLDYINEDFAGVTQRSIDWWNKGGIVSICWHWGTPPNGVGYESSKGKINLEEALTEGTELNKGMLAQMDRVAEELKKLQGAGVPVLWRPFHEFDGQWFWWGKGDADNFIKLWKLMYDRYTNYHGLNNLIWVLGYSDKVKDGWYPGDQYVDIAGSDNYSPGTHVDNFNKLVKIAGSVKPIAYHENGPIPDPDAMMKDQANWSWFLTWHTIHIKEQNTTDYVKKVYQHDYVLTLGELPKFK